MYGIWSLHGWWLQVKGKGASAHSEQDYLKQQQDNRMTQHDNHVAQQDNRVAQQDNRVESAR